VNEHEVAENEGGGHGPLSTADRVTFYMPLLDFRSRALIST
jgi:hypothetical protein